MLVPYKDPELKKIYQLIHTTAPFFLDSRIYWKYALKTLWPDLKLKPEWDYEKVFMKLYKQEKPMKYESCCTILLNSPHRKLVETNKYDYVGLSALFLGITTVVVAAIAGMALPPFLICTALALVLEVSGIMRKFYKNAKAEANLDKLGPPEAIPLAPQKPKNNWASLVAFSIFPTEPAESTDIYGAIAPSSGT